MVFHYSHRFSWEKNTLNCYITCHGYINIHHSTAIPPIKNIRKFWKIAPLDHEGPEMKCTYFHRNCWKRIAKNDRSHAMYSSRITNQSYIEKKLVLKNRENDPFNLKNWIILKISSLKIDMVQGSLNPNITFLGEKLWPVAWKHLLVL